LVEHIYDLALRLLERLHTQAAAQQRTGSIIELAALRALALVARGDQAVVLVSLAEALLLAVSEGYVCVFADEGPFLARLLSRLVTARRAGQVMLVGAIPLDYFDWLALAFRPGSARLASRLVRHIADVAAAAEPLSFRELEI